MGVEAEFPTMMLGSFIMVAIVFAAVIYFMFDKSQFKSARNCFIGQWVLTCVSFFFLFCITGRRTALPAVLTGNVNLTIVLCALCWGVSILLMLTGCFLMIRQAKKKKEG